ncbi:LysR substrate-binding domain-containing protein [Pseudaquabacterium terrae]|uniref:LysR substrate-binding domain-containing protein n=1 Tax=Pseudaquabacterium terrae TaxID=2732868 RepID=UPI001FED1F40|nr:LysR substrate-binding domain-containing protein [Aquabacterium terrae]
MPHIDSLIVFEAVARHQNFARAADEVALTQSAVCRQVGRLEDFLGQPLFNRVRRRLVLTDAGVTYAQQVRESLQRLERDTLGVMSLKAAASNLLLAVPPTISTRWLIPRLPDFSLRHPGILVNLSMRLGPFDLADSLFDGAVHFGPSAWPGAINEFLFGEQLLPMCAPSLLGGAKRLAPSDLGRFQLLHQPAREGAWPRWFEQAGVVVATATKGPRYDMSSMLIEAAIAGMGIALVPRIFVLKDLAAGRLIVPCDVTLESEHGFYIVHAESKRPSQAFLSFQQWLLDCAASLNNHSRPAARCKR